MSDQDPKSQRILNILLIPTTIGLAVLRALKEVLVTQETPASVQDPIDEIEAMLAEQISSSSSSALPSESSTS